MSRRNPGRDRPTRPGEDLARRLRDEIRADGRTVYAIADAAGVARSIVHRLSTGERADLKLSTAAALFAVLNLRVVAGGRRTAPRRSPRPARPPETDEISP